MRVMGYSRDGQLPRCPILIVDDDADALEEYCESATNFGYQAVGVEIPEKALQMLSEDASIGIVVTDLEMPTISGLAFLEEIASRFSLLRPIIPIVITGYGSLDRAVEAMRYNAKDFLTKPVRSESFAAALRRATRTWQELYSCFHVVEMARKQAADGAVVTSEAATGLNGGREELLAQVRWIMRMREKRSSFLDGQLFADPTWDILLDLTAARFEGKPVPVSSACAATNVPLSTALRYVRSLVDAGMVRRWKDTEDRRRDMLELEDSTLDAMTRYLKEVRRRNVGGV